MWNGKDPKLHTYLRKIELWCAHTRTPPNKRGIRLLAVLEGDAFDKMELVEPADLDRADSVAYFISLIRAKYKPLEHRRVGKVMDDFLFRFERRNDEEVNDYSLRFEKELREVEKVAGALTPNWKAHLYLKKMRLRDQQESLILASFLGKYTVEDLRQAALSTFPSVGAMRGSGRDGPPPRRESFFARGGGN